MSEGSAAESPASEETSMSGTKYVGEHRAPTTVRKVVSSRWTRRILVPLAATTAMIFGVGATAFAAPHSMTPETPVASISVAALPFSQDLASHPRLAVEVRPTTYVVQRGDTLTRIAARYCGSASAYRSIGAASGIANFDLIYPGESVRLVCTGGVAPATTHKSQPPVIHAQTASVAVGGSAASVVAFARAQVGKRYVWNTAGPSSYDCSGLVLAAFARVGVKLPHQSGSIMSRGRSVSKEQLQPGDVIGLSSGGVVYHVEIYVGGGMIVAAASPGQGVILSRLDWPKGTFAHRFI